MHATECDSDRVLTLRRLFLEELASEDVTRFIFVDETSTHLPYYRLYGRAPAGIRTNQAVPLHNDPKGTLLAALTPDGLGALLTVKGTVNGDVFTTYLNHVLGPSLQPGYEVILDNLAAHRVDGLAQIPEKYEARFR